MVGDSLVVSLNDARLETIGGERRGGSGLAFQGGQEGRKAGKVMRSGRRRSTYCRRSSIV